MTAIPESFPGFPTRYVNVDAARAKFGAEADRLGRAMREGDPPADAAVIELGPRGVEQVLARGFDVAPRGSAIDALRAHLADVPAWVDFAKVDAGGEALLRTGPVGAMVLICASLPFAYASPAGNKPLMHSGRLVGDALRRASETGYWWLECCLPGGMRAGGGGFLATARTRLMHAFVRQRLLATPSWPSGAWGVPINQADLAATNLLFSSSFLRWLGQVGVRFTADEKAAVMHLWRYVGHVLGIDAALLCETEADGDRLEALWGSTQGAPDEDSKKLVAALLDGTKDLVGAVQPSLLQSARKGLDGLLQLMMGPDATDRLITGAAYELSRELVGAELAAALGYPEKRLPLVVPAIRQVVARSEDLVSVSAGARRKAVEAGTATWRAMLEAALKEHPDWIRPAPKAAAGA